MQQRATVMQHINLINFIFFKLFRKILRATPFVQQEVTATKVRYFMHY
jgi:hypothetical protein